MVRDLKREVKRLHGCIVGSTLEQRGIPLLTTKGIEALLEDA